MNDQTRDPYHVLSRFYDLEFDGFDADLAMYQQFAQSMDGPVLELGCGSGRVLQALQEVGQPLTGVDDSPSMLERARKRLPSTTRLECMDMRFLSDLSGEPFALVFCAVNTFLHLPDLESQILTLQAVRTLTAHDGVLLIDVLLPDPHYLTSIDGRMEHEFHADLDDGTRLDKWSIRSLDLASQTIYSTVYYDVTTSDGAVRRSIGEYSTRYIHLFEMEHLLQRTGWDIVSLYGGYELSPFDNDSDRMIVMATPARED